jgi:hypothetical protein
VWEWPDLKVEGGGRLEIFRQIGLACRPRVSTSALRPEESCQCFEIGGACSRFQIFSIIP